MGTPTSRHEQRRARIAELTEEARRLVPGIRDTEVRRLVRSVLQEKLQTGITLNRLMLCLFREKYIRIPVSVREFVTGKEFLNLPVGQSGVYPKIMEALELLFDVDYSEVVLAGSIGWGKSTFGTIACAYELYRLSCLRDPAATYGMKPGSNMTFVNISVDKRQAERVFLLIFTT